MQFPEHVLRIAEEADAAFPNDVEMAAAECQRRLQELPDYKDILPLLVTRAIRELVYDSRSRLNRQINSDVTKKHSRPKVIVGQSDEVARLYESVYNFRIAGMTLGEMTRSDLMQAAVAERKISAGHLYRAVICERLIPLLKSEDRTVRDAIPERKIRTIMENVRGALSDRSGVAS